MNSKLLILSLGILSVVGCSSGDSPFTTGATSSTDIISSISIAFVDPSLDVLQFNAGQAPVAPATTGSCAELTGIAGSIETEVTATVTDKNFALVSTGTVYFKAQYGTLSASSCSISAGKCSVTWSSKTNIDDLASISFAECWDNGNGTVDVSNNFTAWTLGVETFTDQDGDGKLSSTIATETFIDTEEPYLDRDDSGDFNAGDLLIDETVVNNAHDTANSLYDGSDCDATTRADCSPTTRIPIFAKGQIALQYE